MQTKKTIIFSIRNIRKLAIRRSRLLLARSTAKVASNSLCGLKDLRVIKLNEKCFKIRPFKLLTAAIFLKRPQLTSEVTRDLVRRSRRRQIASFLIFLMEKIIAFLVCTLTTFFNSFFFRTYVGHEKWFLL